MSLEQVRSSFVNRLAALQRLLDSDVPAAVARAAELLAGCVANGGKILLCGNGGSAADCQHIAAELTNRLTGFERPAIPAMALTTDTSYLTARANDHGFDTVFERLVEAFGRSGDALIAISTSGNSPNVIRAVERARRTGILTVGFLGGAGGTLANLVEIPIVIPSDNTQYIQEAHISIGHILCELTESALYGKTARIPG